MYGNCCPSCGQREGYSVANSARVPKTAGFSMLAAAFSEASGAFSDGAVNHLTAHGR